MSRETGMYRRSLIRATGVDQAVLAVAVRMAAENACAEGRHRQETDSVTGNEVCGRCGHIIDDYPDVAAGR